METKEIFVSTENQRSEIKSFIEDELLKRGFNVKVLKFEEVQKRRSTETYFSFETENFQTTPVLFKQIAIGEFNSSISEVKVLEKSNQEYRQFWISVYVHYEHFDHGQNSSKLFEVNGRLFEDRAFIMNVM